MEDLPSPSFRSLSAHWKTPLPCYSVGKSAWEAETVCSLGVLRWAWMCISFWKQILDAGTWEICVLPLINRWIPGKPVSLYGPLFLIS